MFYIWCVIYTSCEMLTKLGSYCVSNFPFCSKNDAIFCPGWCGSADWAPDDKPKDRLFDSRSQHMPGLWARSPVGGMWEATTHGRFPPSPSLSLPLSLKKLITKIFLNIKIMMLYFQNFPTWCISSSELYCSIVTAKWVQLTYFRRAFALVPGIYFYAPNCKDPRTSVSLQSRLFL